MYLWLIESPFLCFFSVWCQLLGNFIPMGHFHWSRLSEWSPSALRVIPLEVWYPMTWGWRRTLWFTISVSCLCWHFLRSRLGRANLDCESTSGTLFWIHCIFFFSWLWFNSKGGLLHLGPGRESFPRCNACYWKCNYVLNVHGPQQSRRNPRMHCSPATGPKLLAVSRSLAFCKVVK